MSCELIDVEIKPQGSTTVTIQPFSTSSLTKHAPTHYLNGNDPINHNQLSGLQGGKSNEYYHLEKKSFDLISSGIASFILDIPSGINQTGILFPTAFSSIPTVHSNIISPITTTYLVLIDSVTTSGFHVYFSSTINNTGYKLQNLAHLIT
jgi:hypothetical protein